jgi:hypothetical protein
VPWTVVSFAAKVYIWIATEVIDYPKLAKPFIVVRDAEPALDLHDIPGRLLRRCNPVMTGVDKTFLLEHQWSGIDRST